jgi:hypothetical protein
VTGIVWLFGEDFEATAFLDKEAFKQVRRPDGRRCVTGNRRWAMQASKSSMKPWKHATAAVFAPVVGDDAAREFAGDGPAQRLIGRLRADLEVRPDILRHFCRQVTHAMRHATLPGPRG